MAESLLGALALRVSFASLFGVRSGRTLEERGYFREGRLQLCCRRPGSYPGL